MRVLHSVASLNPSHGGPSRTITTLCSSLDEIGIEVLLVSSLSKGQSDRLIPCSQGVLTHVLRRPSQCSLPFAFRRYIRSTHKESSIDIVHDHGVWLPTNIASVQTAQSLGIPVVISVRGMFEPWALNAGYGRKTLAWHFYQKRLMQSARLLHATSEAEAKNIRGMGLRQPVAIIPNAVDIPVDPSSTEHFSNNKPARRLLFLSRIHPVKGLYNLIDAWTTVRPPGWELVIAGPADGSHKDSVAKRIREAALGDSVTVVGEVHGDDKWKLYRSSDLFVLPSFSENFGLVVAEALACAVPVITTTGTPWRDLVHHECGWWVAPTTGALADALRDATEKSETELNAMGRRGRALVTERYNWSRVVEEMHEAYLWVLGMSPRPRCINLE